MFWVLFRNETPVIPSAPSSMQPIVCMRWIYMLAIVDEVFAACRFKETTKKSGLVKHTACARLPTEYGEFQVHSYVSNDGLEHAALVEVCFWHPASVYLLFEPTCTAGY